MAAQEDVRTAVVVVHGMGEKRPMETFDEFVRTALHPRDGKWDYHPRPAEITDTYEVRRYAAPERTEFFEYHWPFLMTADKFAGVAPTALRLFLRRPGNVPDALLGIWRLAWTTVLAALLLIPVLFVSGYALNSDVPAWIIGLTISGVVLIFWFGLYRMMARALVNKKTAPLVDSARYMDPSTYSYAARRAIRGGLVMRWSPVRPPLATSDATSATTAPPTSRPPKSCLTPAIRTPSANGLRELGSVDTISCVIDTCRVVLCKSTVGVAPETVMVSSTVPIAMSALTVTTLVPRSSTSLAHDGLEPGQRERHPISARAEILNDVAALLRRSRRSGFSRSVTGLDASTLTPGSTAPDVSFTSPLNDAWAYAAAGKNARHKNDTTLLAKSTLHSAS